MTLNESLLGERNVINTENIHSIKIINSLLHKKYDFELYPINDKIYINFEYFN